MILLSCARETALEKLSHLSSHTVDVRDSALVSGLPSQCHDVCER